MKPKMQFVIPSEAEGSDTLPFGVARGSFLSAPAWCVERTRVWSFDSCRFAACAQDDRALSL